MPKMKKLTCHCGRKFNSQSALTMHFNAMHKNGGIVHKPSVITEVPKKRHWFFRLLSLGKGPVRKASTNVKR